MPELDTRCPCCQAPLLATVTITDIGGGPEWGHDYDVSLELAGEIPIRPAHHESLTEWRGSYCNDCRQVWDMVKRRYVVELCPRHGGTGLGVEHWGCPRCPAWYPSMGEAEACSLRDAERGLARRE